MQAIKLLCAVFVIGLAGIALFHFDPALSRIYPPCLFHQWTGWHCPGCGSSRAAHALVHCNLAKAFSMNPLAFVLLPVAIWEAVASFRADSTLPRVFSTARRIWALVVVVILFWICRNIPTPPFSYLAPGGMG